MKTNDNWGNADTCLLATSAAGTWRLAVFVSLAALAFSAVSCGPGNSVVTPGLRQFESSAMDGQEPDQPAITAGDPVSYPLPSPKTGSIRVGVQAGHWKVAELPDELARRRSSTGAQVGQIKEVDINVAVAKALVPLLEKRGYIAEMLPATVPPGYEADVFISVHADWGNTPSRKGWKLSPPWRSNDYSKKLADSLAAAFETAGVPQDEGGVTSGMRGYFGFNYRRHEHAVSPYTPAVLVELGFLTNPEERTRLTSRPGDYARILDAGIDGFLATYDRADLVSYVPPVFPWLAAGIQGAEARSSPRDGAAIVTTLQPGAIVFPVERSGEWYEVFIRGTRRGAWIKASDFILASDPNWPLPGENRLTR